MPHKIILYGPPGVGKGTQGTLLARALGVPFVSVGDLCRQEIAKGTELGTYVAPYMATGSPAPNAGAVLIRECILQRRLAEAGYVIDGHWRRPVIQDLLSYDRPTHFLHLCAHANALRSRLLRRGRPDDYDTAIARRMAHHEQDEKAVCDFIQAHTDIVYRKVDASGSEDEVAAAIRAAFD